MNTENEIYQILKKHSLPLKKREKLIVDLLDFVNKREKALLIHVVGRSEQLPTKVEMDEKWETLRDAGLDNKLEKWD